MKWIFKALQPCTDIPQYECSECGKRFLDCKSWTCCPNCESKLDGITLEASAVRTQGEE